MTYQDIQVKVSKKYHGVYRDLTQDGKKIFDQYGDVFTLCCSLGFRDGCRRELEKGEGLFQLIDLEPEGVTAIKAIGIVEGGYDYTILEDDKKIVHIAEQYADRGMEIILKTVLGDYHKTNMDGFYLSVSEELLLEKLFLDFICQEFNRAPL